MPTKILLMICFFFCAISSYGAHTTHIPKDRPPGMDLAQTNPLDAMIEFSGAPCIDSLLVFSLSADVTLVNFNWDFGNSTTSEEAMPLAFYQEAGLYTIQFMGEDENGTVLNASLELQIFNCDSLCLDTANIEVQIVGELCIDSSLTLSALTPATLITHAWYIGDQEVVETPEVMPLFAEAGNYSAILVAFDSLGCEYRASSNLFIEDCPPDEGCQGEFPNVFTPNRDEINDFFGLYSNCTATNYQLRIYNRWGQLVFESLNPAEPWDGTYQGKPAPSEVYLWQATYELPGLEAKISKSGDVTLMR